jgi:hypothetical protein
MIPFLMKIYPRAWRKEYGEELAQVVASKPVTTGVLFNILCNGLKERLRVSDPANVAGPCFSLLFAVLDVILIHRDASVFWLWANPLALLLALDATVVAWALARGTTPRQAVRSALLAGVTLLAMASSMQRKTQDLSVLALAAGMLGAHLSGLLLGFAIDRARRTRA